MEQDLCGFAALVMMPLDQTALYCNTPPVIHHPSPRATGGRDFCRTRIDASAQPCAPEDCPLGPFVHEEEELEAPTPS